jgi:hypothetical protein
MWVSTRSTVAGTDAQGREPLGSGGWKPRTSSRANGKAVGRGDRSKIPRVAIGAAE